MIHHLKSAPQLSRDKGLDPLIVPTQEHFSLSRHTLIEDRGEYSGLAAAAAVLFALWLLIKAIVWALRQVLTHWRTSLTVLALGAWWHWWGWASLALTGVVTGWRQADLCSFDAWAGRHLRSWWLRWTVYSPKLPQWLHACGLSIKPDATPVVVTVNPLGRSIPRGRRQTQARLPRVLGVRSGASWDEVRIRLVPGQKPEDFDEAARPLACARAVTRCQVRELTPNVVSIDFQRRNLLTDPVACPDLARLADVAGTAVDLRHVFSERTEYGQDWHVPLAGGHTLVAGSTGADKNSAMCAVDLLVAINAHLAAFELPPITSVQVVAAMTAPQVTVQLTCHNLGDTARGLLAWSYTSLRSSPKRGGFPRVTPCTSQ